MTLHCKPTSDFFKKQELHSPNFTMEGHRQLKIDGN